MKSHFLFVIELIVVINQLHADLISIIYDIELEYHDVENLESDICLTEGCIESSYRIFKYMNESIDPCDDFYEYACGRFVSESFIPEGQIRHSPVTQIQKEVIEQLQFLINKPIDENEIKPFKDLKLFNKACMNLTAINALGIAQVLQKIEEIGGWPALGDNWDESIWSWEKAIAKLRSIGILADYIFTVRIAADLQNNTIKRIAIDLPQFPLELMQINPQSLIKFSFNLAKLLKSNLDDHELEEKMKDAIEFQYRLQKLLTPPDFLTSSGGNGALTILQLQKMYPQLNWLSYFNSIMIEGSILTSKNLIINPYRQFFKKLFLFLDETPKETIANYIMLRFVLEIVPYLPEEFRDSYRKYINEEINCSHITTKVFVEAVASLYSRNYLNEDTKTEIQDMVRNIKNELKIIVDDIDWMDKKDKKKSHRKIENMGVNVGYVEDLLDDGQLTEFYEQLGVEIDMENIFETFLKISAAKLKFEWQFQEPNVNVWSAIMPPNFVNAFYEPMKNQISFLPSILRGVYFNINRPRYMNYGAIGTVIGHEITHGFDDNGSLFDYKGNIVKWRSNETETEFKNRIQCLIDQYQGYVDPNTKRNLNGTLTQSENIADNGGVKESYYAYQKWVKNNNPEPKLPGINLTQNQLFWVSAAHVFCNIETRDETIRRLSMDGHTLDRFRVLGMLQNRPEFAKDFNCRRGSPMNPLKKCSVW